MARRQLIVPQVGGFLAPLPSSARNEIERRWPSVDLSKIENEFGYYLLEKAALEAQPPASEIDARYSRLQQRVAELLPDLAWLDSSNLGGLIEQQSPERAFDILGTTRRNLQLLGPLLRRGRRYLPAGQQVNPRHLLAFRIGGLVVDAGMTADARPKGPLCQIVAVLLDAAGERPSSVVTIVKAIVEKLKKPTSPRG